MRSCTCSMNQYVHFCKQDLFRFLSSNIPSSSTYDVFICQLIRYARACPSYECFILRDRRLSSKLLKQGYLVGCLKALFRKCYGRYEDLIQQYEVSLSWMLHGILTLDQPIRPSTNSMTLIQSFTFTELWVVSMEHLQRLWHARREHLPFRTPGSAPLFETCLCSNCWDQIPGTCHFFYSTSHLEYSLVLYWFWITCTLVKE